MAQPLSPQRREHDEPQVLPEEPPGRPLLQEPPGRPATGLRRPPKFPGRRGAGGTATAEDSPLPSRGAGWTVISYLIAGMMAYGGIGWLISRAVHVAIIFPVGMLFGLGVSMGLVIYRYGRSSSTQNQQAKETLREEPAGDR